MHYRFTPIARPVLLILAVLGLILAACAPAAAPEPATGPEAPPVATEAAAEEPFPEVPAPAETAPRVPPVSTPTAPAPEEPVEEEPVEEELVEEEPVEEEPVEEELVEEEPIEEEPIEEEPVEEEPVEEAAPPVDGPLTVAINAGGPEVMAGGITWTADQFFEGGRTTTNAEVTEIEGTADGEIYLTARIAEVDLAGFSYSIPVPEAGVYEVRLHFAEVYFGAPGAGAGGGEGSRVFNVSFEEGVVELRDIDIHAEAGAATAVVKAFEVPVEDGVLDIVFTASVNRPLVSAIEVSGPIATGTGN